MNWRPILWSVSMLLWATGEHECPDVCGFIYIQSVSFPVESLHCNNVSMKKYHFLTAVKVYVKPDLFYDNAVASVFRAIVISPRDCNLFKLVCCIYVSMGRQLIFWLGHSVSNMDCNTSERLTGILSSGCGHTWSTDFTINAFLVIVILLMNMGQITLVISSHARYLQPWVTFLA